MASCKSVSTKSLLAQKQQEQHQKQFLKQLYRSLLIGDRNELVLTWKEQGIVWKAKRYQFDIASVSSKKHHCAEEVHVGVVWKLFHFGVSPTTFAQAGVGILVSPKLTEWNLIETERVCRK